METLVMMLGALGAFAAGVVIRLAVLPVIVMLLALPLLAVLMGARGADILWHRSFGIRSLHAPLWKAT